ncbi:hypothetical protein [Rhodococcus sp. NPDC058481]|uniref:hypothetical protein n=1 Tax=unclassified Rhodococcus (in: high G+C Gram-positive bacteria) TaxID=192944 RepID=UPI003667670D
MTTTTTVSSAPAPAPNPVGPTDNSGAPLNNQQDNVPAPNPVPTNQGQVGADGSTGNNLSAEYCAQNQDPGCPIGSYVGPNAIANPNGDPGYVPCEGTICTNPNSGAGTNPSENGGDQGSDQGPVAGAPCEGDGTWVHAEGGNAAHYGTEWLCRH